MMTVGELIEKLSSYPKDCAVFIQDEESEGVPCPFVGAKLDLDYVGFRDDQYYWVTDDIDYSAETFDSTQLALVIITGEVYF